MKLDDVLGIIELITGICVHISFKPTHPDFPMIGGDYDGDMLKDRSIQNDLFINQLSNYSKWKVFKATIHFHWSLFKLYLKRLFRKGLN